MDSVSTKTGDAGTSGLANGQRLPKTHTIFTVLGAADELNAHLGKAVVICKRTPECAEFVSTLVWLQEQLFFFGAEVAQSPNTRIASDALEQIEMLTTKLQSQLEDRWQTLFLLPGGSDPAAVIDIARAVTRRLELHTWELAETEIAVRPEALVFLNRLSDYLYVLRCAINDALSVDDIPFIKSKT